MLYVAWSVCLSVCSCVGRTDVPCKMAELIQMLFGGLTLMGPRNHVLDGGQDQRNLLAAARGDKAAIWPFAKLL